MFESQLFFYYFSELEKTIKTDPFLWKIKIRWYLKLIKEIRVHIYLLFQCIYLKYNHPFVKVPSMWFLRKRGFFNKSIQNWPKFKSKRNYLRCWNTNDTLNRNTLFWVLKLQLQPPQLQLYPKISRALK